MKLKIYKNAVVLRTKNKRFAITKTQKSNEIEITSLTKENTKEPGTTNFISQNGKLKYSIIGISDEGLESLYLALKEYLKNIK